jgi:hypothetical protein
MIRFLLVPFTLSTLLLSGCSPSVNDGRSWFVEAAIERGIDFQHVSGAVGGYLLPEIMGGGVALVDVDGDDDLDAYFVQSGTVAVLATSAAGDGVAGPPNQLYLNRGDGYFDEARASGAGDAGYGMGVTTGDYDNDGDVDLYVTNVGANTLLQNKGDGTFEDVTSLAGVGDTGFSTAATFFDADSDGDLDLFVANYVAWSIGLERDCHDYGTGVRNYCDPGNYEASAQDRLFRNNGDATFTDVTDQAGITAAFGNGLGVVSADFNSDGRADVFVANDKTMNQLWINEGDMKFVDEALLWGCAVDNHGIAKAGMGVASADIDDDGDADLVVVNIEGETDSVYRNEGGYFVDATARTGLGTTSRRYTRFGVALVDFNNDGWLDLYEANGRVTHQLEAEARDVFAEPNVLYRGSNAGFTEIAIGSLVHTSRGLAYGDVDNDGGVDMLVMNRDAGAYLLMNQAPNRGQWLRISVLDRNGRHAHGAVVRGTVGTARKSRTVQTAGSYLAAHDPRVHFGLGTNRDLTNVSVQWPTGELESFGTLAASESHSLHQSRQSRDTRSEE